MPKKRALVLVRFRGERALQACAFAWLVAGCAWAAPLPPKAIELNRTGAAAFASGDLETAEARLALAVEYNPRFTEAWVNLGLVELRRGNLVQAEKDFLRARRLNPDLPAPHHSLGVLADKEGRGPDAEKFYRAALKVDPGFAPARANLARRLFERGAFDEAREQFTRLTEVAPETLEGWLGLAESLLRLGRDGEADDVTLRACSGFGDAPDLVLLVARQKLRAGSFADAEALLTPLTKDMDGRRRGHAWAWIAVARLGAEDPAGATLAAREALRVDEKDTVAAYAMKAAHRETAR